MSKPPPPSGSEITLPAAPRDGGRHPDGAPAAPLGARGMVIGVIVMALFLLGFGLWADRAGRAAGDAPAVPELLLLEPADGVLVPRPVSLIFETPVELRHSRDGWGSRGYHVHAEVNGIEVMPGINDINRLPDGRYRWVLGSLAPGAHELRLFWSDRRHREVAGSSSPNIRVVVPGE